MEREASRADLRSLLHQHLVALPPNQQEVAKRLGTSVENFRVWLSRLRQTYRHALRAEVASTVSDPTEIDDELHYVYRILTA